METENLNELIEESIRLELNMSRLYSLFTQACPLDRDFWWQLHLEEKSHAALLRAGRDSFLKQNIFPRSLLAGSLKELNSSNQQIEKLIEQCEAAPPDRIEAFRAAAQLERGAGELHYSCFMKRKAENQVENVFQQLNRDDLDHEARINERCGSIMGTA